MSFLAELRQVPSPSRTPLAAPSGRAWTTPVGPLSSSSTRYAFAKAFAVAAAAYVIATATFVYLAGTGVPAAALAVGSVGSAMSLFVIASVLPAIMVGMLVRQSRRNWSVARIVAVYLPLFLLMTVLQFGSTAADAWWSAGMIVANG